MKNITALLMALFFVLGFAKVSADTFDLQPFSNGWVTDRYKPNIVESVNFDGDNRLHLGTDPKDGPGNRAPAFAGTFYNTQGIQKQALINGDWKVSGEVYVSDDMLSSDYAWRTDLWARTGLVGDESTADYAIFSLARFDITDPFGGSNMTTQLRAWDSNVGWINLNSALITTGWNAIGILGTSAGFTYDFNGYANVFNDSVVQMPQNLTTMFVEAYNFGGEAKSYYWDNVDAGSPNVPDSGSTLSLALLALTGIVVAGRRKSVTSPV